LPSGFAIFLAAGYTVGQRIPSSGMFDQGIMVGSNLGKKWSHNETVNYFAVRQPNRSSSLRRRRGAALFANIRSWRDLIGNLGGHGERNDRRRRPTVLRERLPMWSRAFNLNYSGSMMHPQLPLPVLCAGHAQHGASLDENAFMIGGKFGPDGAHG